MQLLLLVGLLLLKAEAASVGRCQEAAVGDLRSGEVEAGGGGGDGGDLCAINGGGRGGRGVS